MSNYVFIVAAVMGMKSKDESTAGTMAFCAFADIANSPVGGKFTSIIHHNTLFQD